MIENQRTVQQGVLILLYSMLLIGVALALYSVRWVLLLSLIGAGLGTLLIPAHEFLRDKAKIPRGVTAFVFLLLALTAIYLAGYFLVHLIGREIAPLLSQLPAYLDQARERLIGLLSGVPGFEPSSLRSLNFDRVLQTSVSTFLQGLQMGGTAIGAIIFVTALTLYLATDSNRYFTSVISVLPAHTRTRARNILGLWASTLRKWFYAQLLVMTTVGFLTGLVLWFLGVQYWLAFGLLGGLLDIIPYFGPIVSTVGITLITLGSQPDIAHWVLLGLFLVQQVENYLLVPLILKGRIELPPVYLLILMFVMGKWFGVLGIFVAPPVMAMARSIIVKYHIPKMNTEGKPAAAPANLQRRAQ